MPDAEVDQSIHIEYTRADTIIALANDLRRTIRIPAPVKRAAVDFLRQTRKHPMSKKRIAIRMLAAAVYLLLRDCIPQVKYVIIDVEYWGYESEIKGMILACFSRIGVRVSPKQIAFGQVGKNSPAHDLAIRTLRGELREDKRITEAEFLAAVK
ncbi:MAG: hypothetical protein FJ009_01220 [Chloroflexi bacterium]|nr:hypothetical protein [Chloroflexota bacterium]